MAEPEVARLVATKTRKMCGCRLNRRRHCLPPPQSLPPLLVAATAAAAALR